MYRLYKEITIPAGHFLRDYDGPCARPHGHNYTFKVTLTAVHLDGVGMVSDFTDIKTVIKRWDHHMLNDFPEFSEGGMNPTAENIAFVTSFLLVVSLLGRKYRGLHHIEVRVCEKEMNVAIWSGTVREVYRHLIQMDPGDSEGLFEAARDLGGFPEEEVSKEETLAHGLLIDLARWAGYDVGPWDTFNTIIVGS